MGEVVFGPDGETFGFVDFTLDAFEPGDLTVTVEPGPDHTVGPDGVVTIEVLDEPELLADCGDDLGSPPDGDDRQTIAVGEAPDPIGFFEDFDDDGDDGTDEVTVGVVQYGDGTEYRYQEGGLQAAPEGFSTTVISGALPPGLAYAADVWTGTATTPGTYDFDVRLCVDESSFVGDTPVTDAERSLARAQLARAIPDTICFGSVDVRIVVEPAAATTTPAAPAAPIATAARFTG